MNSIARGTPAPLPLLLLLSLLAFLLVSTFGAKDARACTCARVSPEEGLRESEAVFSGEVVDIDADADEDFVPGPPPLHLDPVTFEIEESWKGISEGQQQVVVRGDGPGASCGIQFREGERYLVYAYRGGEGEDGPLGTGVCEGTKPLAVAEDDLRVLNSAESTLPESGGPILVGTALRSTVSVVAASAALLSLAAVGVRALRRRRHSG